MRIEGHNSVGLVAVNSVQACNVELNLKLSQVDALKLDQLGCDRQHVILTGVPEFSKLLITLDELLVYIPE